MATTIDGELLTLSSPRNPYPGKFGVVDNDVVADLLLVDGEAFENMDLLWR
jgi:hypothetical protein